jgi:VanZ family protein
MTLSKTQALKVLALLLLMLLVGTQMPGSWRDGAMEATHMPMGATKVAHFLAFLGLAWVARSAPLRWPLWVVLTCALLLALGTEGLQFFASNREPSVRDVLIDMAGASLGAWLAKH